MPIQGINSFCPAVNFRAKNNQNYENPINRKTERNLAVLSSVGVSSLAGVIAGGATTLFGTKGWKVPTLAGAAVGLVALALTLPAKLYNAKVGAFTREKETDVFSRQKEAQTNIYEDINDEIKNDNVSLDQKINHYSTVKMADNGNGLIVKDV